MDAIRWHHVIDVNHILTHHDISNLQRENFPCLICRHNELQQLWYQYCEINNTSVSDSLIFWYHRACGWYSIIFGLHSIYDCVTGGGGGGVARAYMFKTRMCRRIYLLYIPLLSWHVPKTPYVAYGHVKKDPLSYPLPDHIILFSIWDAPYTNITILPLISALW